MKTVRRIYLYAVALISVEVLIWGSISLARSIFRPGEVIVSGEGATLARGLALVLVGVPVFLLHWMSAQRSAQHEMEERAAGIRATFLYGVLLGTLIPVVQNILALVNRPVLGAMRLASTRALVGGTQAWSDNLIAIALNLLAAAYFLSILRGDWRVAEPKDAFITVRRIYRWFWTLYGLGLTVVGVNQMLRFLLFTEDSLANIAYQRYWAVNGMVATLVGAPIWVYSWLTLQRAQQEQAERESLLRVGVLYILSLTGVIVTLASGGGILDAVLRLVFGVNMTLPELLPKITYPLAVGVPFLGIWLYYGGWLKRAMADAPDAPRRAGMRRVYASILAGLGVAVTFLGLAFLQSYLVDLALTPSLESRAAGGQLTAALTMLLIGLPLWLLSWRPMQAEAFDKGDAGDHARRSLTRRIFLYLALFAGVIGGMITAVALLYTVLNALLAGETAGLGREVAKEINILVLFAVLGIYHGLTMRRDGRNAASALAAMHANYPVVIFDPGDGFGTEMLTALMKAMPNLPAVLQPADQPAGEAVKPLAVVLPLDLAMDLPAALRKWLDKFEGRRLVVPRPSGKWSLIGQPKQLPLHQTVLAVRQLAEGQEARTTGTPGWLIAVYVAAGIVGLPILVSLLGSLISAFMR